MPKPTGYTCTKCSLRGSDTVTWGNFFYLIDGEKITIHRTAGICYRCDAITPVEVLEPNEFHELPEEFLKQRTSPARCLDCGGHDFDAIPLVEPDPERLRAGTPVSTGLFHRNCGGRIYADFDRPNFFMGSNLSERLFNEEGLPVQIIQNTNQ